MCLRVFLYNLSPYPFWSTSWFEIVHCMLHTFLYQSLSFLQHMPTPLQPFRCSTEIIPSNPSLSLNPLLGTLSCRLTPRVHLTILISARCCATSFSFLTGQVSLPCNILLCTQLLYSEWQCYELGHMHICTWPQTDNHVNTPPLSFFTGPMPFLLPNQQCQSTEGSIMLMTWL